jgi:polyisoprenoid-binding protein YceI
MAWLIDSSHTRANFSVRHMMISNVHGAFDKVEGVVDFDEADPARSSVEVKIAADSILTRDEKRDAHLKSPDFLDAARYPYLIFKSKRAEKTSDTTGRLVGALTIRDVTREVALEVEYNGQAKSPWGALSAGFTATARINRKDWGLNWNVALETGGVLVGDVVTINLEVEIIKQPEAVVAAAAA